jgi:hypothetical protein
MSVLVLTTVTSSVAPRTNRPASDSSEKTNRQRTNRIGPKMLRNPSPAGSGASRRTALGAAGATRRTAHRAPRSNPRQYVPAARHRPPRTHGIRAARMWTNGATPRTRMLGNYTPVQPVRCARRSAVPPRVNQFRRSGCGSRRRARRPGYELSPGARTADAPGVCGSIRPWRPRCFESSGDALAPTDFGHPVEFGAIEVGDRFGGPACLAAEVSPGWSYPLRSMRRANGRHSEPCTLQASR